MLFMIGHVLLPNLLAKTRITLWITLSAASDSTFSGGTINRMHGAP